MRTTVTRPFRPANLESKEQEAFSLFDLAKHVRSSNAYVQSGKSALSLARSPELTVTAVLLRQHTTINEHHSPGPAVVTVLSGKIEFVCRDEAHQLAAGDTIVFPGGMPHTVTAIEDSLFTISIGGHTGIPES